MRDRCGSGRARGCEGGGEKIRVVVSKRVRKGTGKKENDERDEEQVRGALDDAEERIADAGGIYSDGQGSTDHSEEL